MLFLGRLGVGDGAFVGGVRAPEGVGVEGEEEPLAGAREKKRELERLRDGAVAEDDVPHGFDAGVFVFFVVVGARRSRRRERGARRPRSTREGFVERDADDAAAPGDAAADVALEEPPTREVPVLVPVSVSGGSAALVRPRADRLRLAPRDAPLRAHGRGARGGRGFVGASFEKAAGGGRGEVLGDEVSLLSNPDEPQRRLLGVGRVRREVAEAEREGRGLALEHRLQRELDAAADRAVADDQARERGVLEDRPGARRSRGDAAEDRNVDRVADGGPPPGPDGGGPSGRA